jgi:hypothetical protein
MGYQGGGRRYGAADYDRDYDNRYRGGNTYRGYRGEPASYGGYRSRPSDYDEDRGFFDRAGDEIRSWFGDEEAERRREYDDYMNRRYGDPRDQSSRIGFASSGPGGYRPRQGYAPYTGERSGYGSEDHGYRTSYGPRPVAPDYDQNYSAWREERLAELDRDYSEYQRENRSRFDSEFGMWRTRRSNQRSSLGQVKEHMEVVGSDGVHVGKVDKAVGDRIILTRTDKDAGGVHHSIPSRWIESVTAETVTLEKTAEQAKVEWRNEDQRTALFGSTDRDDSRDSATGRNIARYRTY